MRRFSLTCLSYIRPAFHVQTDRQACRQHRTGVCMDRLSLYLTRSCKQSIIPLLPYLELIYTSVHTGAHTSTHTPAVRVNSSSTLLLAITAEGHTSAEGLSSRKEKKKGGFLCNLGPELAGAQESCSSQARETRTQPQWLLQPDTFINTHAVGTRTVTVPPIGSQGRCRGNTQQKSWTLTQIAKQVEEKKKRGKEVIQLL